MSDLLKQERDERRREGGAAEYWVLVKLALGFVVVLAALTWLIRG